MAPAKKNPIGRDATKARQVLESAAVARAQLQERGDDDLADAVVGARQAGLSVEEIRQLAGFKTRQGVYDLLDRREPPRPYRLTCRAILDDAVVAKLDEQGIYWFRGGEVQIGTELRRHHLIVEAETAADAQAIARETVERAGGRADDIQMLDE